MPKRKTRAYVDFEFCSLEDTTPISLGLVLEDVGHYYEFDGWTVEQCSPWVRENVLPHLSGPRQDRKVIAEQVHQLLLPHPGGTIVADNSIDLRLLLGVLGTLAPGWRCAHALFAPRTYPEIAPSGLRPHHALDDALALKAITRHFELEGYNAITEPQLMIPQSRDSSRFT
jgi:hypothetical protein